MTSCSDNVFDVTIFCCFEKFLADILFLPSFIVVRHQMGELKRGEGVLLPLPFHYRGIPDPVQNRVNICIYWVCKRRFIWKFLFLKSSTLDVAFNFLYSQASSLKLSIFIKHRRYGQTGDDHSDIVLDLFTKNTSLGAPFTTCRFCFSFFSFLGITGPN